MSLDPARLLGLGRNAVRLSVGLLMRNNNLRRLLHLTLIGVAEDSGCRKCGLEEESSFYIFCECNARAGMRERVLGQAYPDATNIRRL